MVLIYIKTERERGRKERNACKKVKQLKVCIFKTQVDTIILVLLLTELTGFSHLKKLLLL